METLQSGFGALETRTGQARASHSGKPGKAEDSKQPQGGIFHINISVWRWRKMDAMMKTSARTKRLLCIVILLLGAAELADAQDIYKCTKNGQVAYTDHACASGKGELLHQADDSEIIDQYLDLGQDDVAKRYAHAHNIDSLYKQRVEVRKQRMVAKAQQQADEDAADRQQDEAAQQQALLDAAADRGRLQGENDALRQQNAQYQDQLSQPVSNDAGAYYNASPGYWGGRPPYGGGHDGGGHDGGGHDHGDGGHGPGPSKPPPPPVFHPCVPVAGGTVKC